ncbi:hypothetical protein EDB86DRAFT_1011892 [Lactarius hatsudake]|nr:hypothetical protein EDB86DRAFT_1011892 [Lactarius hatsudake]
MPLQFRAMSNKRPPSEPSFFVVGVLRPVRAFFGMEWTGPDCFYEGRTHAIVRRRGPRSRGAEVHHLRDGDAQEGVVEKTQEGEQTRHHSLSSEEDGRDEERVRQQMVLDVEAFGKDAETLGVDVQGSVSFKSLLEMAIAQ